jgi:plasmid stabilization system protein ParE
MMHVEFLTSAQAELAEAVDYYNSQRKGLGFEFAEEIQRIVQHPRAWTNLSKRTRRCRTQRFPYGVIYQIKDNTILIVAVMHLRREPRQWKDRRSRGEQ